MKPLSFLIIFLTVCSYVSAQESGFVTDHNYYLNILGSAKDSLYKQVLSQYDSYILRHPEDSKTSIERCKFIQNAYYDSYEDYNPNADQASTCAQDLLTTFPGDPDVLIFQTQFFYGDSALNYLEKLSTTIENDPVKWKDHSWIVYKQLAENHRYNDNHKEVVKYAYLASEKNDTLDLSLLLAEAHKNLNQRHQAIDVLVQNLDSTNLGWELNQKGSLLLELGVPEKALEALRMAARDSSGYENIGALANAMIDNGLTEEARAYLLRDYKENTWNPTKPLQKLLEYDLQYASPDSAAFTYDRFVADNFWNDPVGIYRLKLFVKSPLLPWSLADAGRLFILLILFLVILIIPYLWVLPIHYFGALQKSKGKVFPQSTFKWGLKHFWLACSLWLLCDILTSLIFDYPGIISIINENITLQDATPISKTAANLMLFFCTGSFAFTIIFLKREDIVQFFHKVKDIGPQIGAGIGLAFLLRVGMGIYLQLLKGLGISYDPGTSGIASIADSIVSLNQFYNPYLGFLLVVVLVPFYEEILFRGVFLSACERNMKFVFANIVQSLAFALVHQELKLIPFYFAFGMIAGHYRHKTQSLTIGTSMHMTNNLMAFLFLLIGRS